MSSNEADEINEQDSKKRDLTPRLRFSEFRETQWEKGKIENLFNLKAKPEKSTGFDREKIITVKLHTNGVVKNERSNTLTGGTNYFKRHAGEFIFSKIDLLNGAFGLVPDELDGFYSSSDVPAFAFNKYGDSHFFLNWLQANYQKLQIERTGTSNTLKRVAPNKFLSVSIWLPDVKEQQKIADCLSSLDELITAETQKLHNLNTHRNGLVQQLFPRNGETIPRLRFPEFQDDLQWIHTKLGNMSKIQSGGTPLRANTAYWGGDIPWVTTSLIDSNTITKADEYITGNLRKPQK